MNLEETWRVFKDPSVSFWYIIRSQRAWTMNEKMHTNRRGTMQSSKMWQPAQWGDKWHTSVNRSAMCVWHWCPVNCNKNNKKLLIYFTVQETRNKSLLHYTPINPNVYHYLTRFGFGPNDQGIILLLSFDRDFYVRLGPRPKATRDKSAGPPLNNDFFCYSMLHA